MPSSSRCQLISFQHNYFSFAFTYISFVYGLLGVTYKRAFAVTEFSQMIGNRRPYNAASNYYDICMAGQRWRLRCRERAPQDFACIKARPHSMRKISRCEQRHLNLLNLVPYFVPVGDYTASWSFNTQLLALGFNF